MKNKTKIFFVLTLLALLLAVTTVSAVDDDTSDIVSQTPTTDTSTDVVSREQLQSSSDDKIVNTENKKIEKEDKNVKTSTKIVNINNMDEFTTTINNAVNDPDNDEYIINLNEGTYTFSSNILFEPGNENYQKNIIINGENQTISGSPEKRKITFSNNCDIIINNLTMNCRITNQNNLTINNSNLLGNVENYNYLDIKKSYINGVLMVDGKTIIDEETTFGNGFNPIIYKALLTNNTYLIEKLTQMGYYAGNNTIENTITTETIKNMGKLTLNNVTINSTIENYDRLIINDDCVFGENFILKGDGEITINDMNRILPYITTFNGNNIYENITINSNKTNNGNLTLINSNISALITNNAEITFINCSFSNNEMTAEANSNKPLVDGFLLQNNGNATLIDCTMENNTFNNTSQFGQLSLDFYGPIVNTGSMNINNSIFNSNKLGYVNVTSEYNQGYCTGIGGVIVNKNILTIENSTFTNNYAAARGGSIANYAQLLIKDSVFDNNTATISGGAINIENGTTTISNTNFTRNNVVDLLNDQQTIGGAIASWRGNTTITGCIFDSNNVIINTVSLMGVYGRGGAVAIADSITTITDSKFTNNTADKGSAISIGERFTYTGEEKTISNITNNTFSDNYGITTNTYESSIIYDDGHANIINNNFTNNNATYTIDNFIGIEEDFTASSRYYNETITNNTFTDNNNKANTIRINENQTANVTIEGNSYSNTTINDTITLNIPSKVYAGEPVTITGTYTINNPEYYDENILEQTQFQVYINGEVDKKVDTLDFTITPTTENMIITVQPTTSQTRKSAIIKASILILTLEDITATIGETTQLRTQITLIEDDENVEVNTGRVYFKVNGKILRDTDSGRILYADVTENTATLDYSVPKSWNNETSIEAIYTGNDELPTITSETITPTITTPEAQESEFTVSDTTASAGSEVTITVTTKDLDAGKVVLKVNGKTVKATDNKLYAKVTGDTLTFTYTVPKTYKAGEYTVKAVYTSGATKLEAEGILTVE